MEEEYISDYECNSSYVDSDDDNELYLDALEEYCHCCLEHLNRWIPHIKAGKLLYHTVYNYMRGYKHINIDEYYSCDQIFVIEFGDLITERNRIVKRFIVEKIKIQCNELKNNSITLLEYNKLPTEVVGHILSYLDTNIIRKTLEKASIPYGLRDERFGNIASILFNAAPDILAESNMDWFIPYNKNKLSDEIIDAYHNEWCMHPYISECLCTPIQNGRKIHKSKNKYRLLPAIDKNNKAYNPSHELYEFWDA